jgi:hypothetical protein
MRFPSLLQFIGLGVTLAVSSSACASAGGDQVPTPDVEVAALDAGHTLLGRTLRAVVRPTGVDYAALRKDHADLDRYRAQLAKTSIPAGEAAKKVLLINAYNAWTLALVDRLLPDDERKWPEWSIKSGGTTLTSVWKRYTFELGGKWHTLDQVEHEMLRPMGDPRIHFAINCASRSCPPLTTTPYVAEKLDAQLDAVATAFVADPAQVRLEEGKLLVNPLLDWFEKDFEKAGGVREFLRARAPEGPVKKHLAGGGKIGFLDYDWRLNLARKGE